MNLVDSWIENGTVDPDNLKSATYLTKMTRLQTMCARYAKPMTIIRIYSAVMVFLNCFL